MRIRKINVSRFRAIGQVKVEECSAFNAIIGKNNAGKSTVLRCIELFFLSLQEKGLVNVDPPVKYPDDWNDPGYTPSIELALSTTEDERTDIIGVLKKEASQASLIVDALPDPLFVELVMQFGSAQFGPYAYVSRISLAHADGRAANVVTIPDKIAELLAVRQSKVRDYEHFAEVIRAAQRSFDENKEMFSRGRAASGESVPLGYFMDGGPSRRIVQRRVMTDIRDPEIRREREIFGEKTVPVSDVPAHFDECLGKIALSINALRAEPLPKEISTISGVDDKIPTYATAIAEKIAAVSIMVLGERREPIGEAEAQKLLDLKIRRGGAEQLKRVQQTVDALLGVRIDAFSERGRPREAELDVDGFLVQVNGSGIREALRIVLDYELNQPEVLLLEEPEVHLHPALENSVMAYMRAISSQCQIFLTTHSTNFLDGADASNILFTNKTAEGTKVSSLTRAEAEEIVPRELGIRLSSLFMYDKLVFVEGKSDEDVVRGWADVLQINLAALNVGFIPIGGVRNMFYYAAHDIMNFLLRRNVDIYFIIDRDEKDDGDVERLRRRLTDGGVQPEHVYVTPGRQIENLLIEQNALTCHIRGRLNGQGRNGEDVQGDAIRGLIESSLASKRESVLLKRMKGLMRLESEIDAYRRSIAMCDGAGDLARCADQLLTDVSAVVGEFSKRVEAINVELEQNWQAGRFQWVPGDVVLDDVLKHWGLRYRKTRDAGDLARCFQESRIPNEVTAFIRRFER